MNYHNTKDSEEEKKPKDSEKRQGGSRPTEKPNALYSEYLNAIHSKY